MLAKFGVPFLTSFKWQIGVESTRQNALLLLLAQIISDPCFNVLRTQQQLGYIVFSGHWYYQRCAFLRFIVQSDRHPTDLDTHMEAFIATIPDLIGNMSESEFATHQKSVVTTLV
jgi:insulysin